MTDQELLDTLRKVEALLATITLDPANALHKAVNEWLNLEDEAVNTIDERVAAAIGECEEATGDYTLPAYAERWQCEQE